MSWNETLISEKISENASRATSTEVKANLTSGVYQEIPGRKSEQLDVIEQLQSNIAHLEDLQGRMKFVMLELQTLVRVR